MTMGLAIVGAVGGTIATGGMAGLLAGAIAGGAGGRIAGKRHVKKVKKRMDGIDFEGIEPKNDNKNGDDEENTVDD